jgi:peptidylprolyl isomerase
MFNRFLLTAGSIALMTTSAHAMTASPSDTVTMELSNGGKVTMQLMPDIAPKHAERIKTLAGEGFYNGITFHRVIDGFMAQTGDPTGTGSGGSSLPNLPAEFSDYTYKRGTVGMARTSDPNSANSQFFICFNDTGCKGLTGQYTVIGQVMEGMESVDTLAKGEPPANPDKIMKMTVGMGSMPATAGTEPAMSPSDAEPAAGSSAAMPSEGMPSAKDMKDMAKDGMPSKENMKDMMDKSMPSTQGAAQ